MWNMGPDPPYISAKFGEDSLKPKKVMAKNHRIVDEKKKNTTRTKGHSHYMGMS